MNVTFEGRMPCLLCGCMLRAFRFSTVRRNKHSMRETTPSIVAVDLKCPECQSPNHDAPRHWWLVRD